MTSRAGQAAPLVALLAALLGCVAVGGSAGLRPPAASAVPPPGDAVLLLEWEPMVDPSHKPYGRYSLRWRASVVGEPLAPWKEVPQLASLSYEVGVPTSREVCWSVRGESDGYAVQGDWTLPRCVSTHGAGPTVPSTHLDTWLPLKKLKRNATVYFEWRPTFRYASTAERGVIGYQVERQRRSRTWPRGPVSAMEAPYLIDDGRWRTTPSLAAHLEPAGADCYRARARDVTGWLSAWSGWRCTYAPGTSYDGFFAYQVGVTTGMPGWKGWTGRMLTTSRSHTHARSAGKYCAKGVRIEVRKGVRLGRAAVYIGQQRIGTFSGKARKGGSKWVRLAGARTSCGYIRFRPLTKAATYVRAVYVLH